MTRISTTLLCLAALLAASAQPAGAQGALDERMRAFLAALPRRYQGPDFVAEFFPRRGDWTWVQRFLEAPGPARSGRWRFPGARTQEAMEPGAPLCNSLAWRVRDEEHLGGWRRAGRTRYVLPGSGPGSPVFVEWREEDGRWVVDAVGDIGYWTPSRANEHASSFTRDTTLAPGVPEEATYAAGQIWYDHNEVIKLRSYYYIKWGPPRPRGPGELSRFGSLGSVPVYVEAGEGRPSMEVIYVLARPGEYQAYHTEDESTCDVW